MILNSLNKQRVKIKTLSLEKWRNFIQSKTLTQNESAAFMALCRLMPKREDFEQLRSMDLFQATNAHFDQSNTQKYLKTARINVPKPDKVLLEKYIKRILKK